MAGPSAPLFPLGGLSSRCVEPEGQVGDPGGPCLTPSFSCPTVSLLRRLGEHIRQLQESSVLGLSLGQEATALPKEGWLEQPLDPFNTSDRRSFLQVRPLPTGEWESTAYPALSCPCSVLQPLHSSHLSTSAPLSVTLCLLSVSLMAFSPAPPPS